MTITLEITPELEEALRRSAERSGLPPDGYVLKVLEERLGGEERLPPHLPREESRLLQQINQGLPPEVWTRYETLKGLRCYASLADLPEAPELVAIVLSASRVNQTLEQAAAAGAKAAIIIASEEAAKRNGLTPKARVPGAAVAGVPPRIMGIGPAPASEKLMKRLGLKIGDFDVIELNEAFASQSLACMRQLGLADDAEHVNPNGGAIALGHPLGMSGARIAMTAAHQLTKTGGKRGLATMCVGVGQGVSLAIERV